MRTTYLCAEWMCSSYATVRESWETEKGQAETWWCRTHAPQPPDKQDGEEVETREELEDSANRWHDRATVYEKALEEIAKWAVASDVTGPTSVHMSQVAKDALALNRQPTTEGE